MSKLVVIAGPTAVGKSEVAIKLAKKINAKIVSADSVQIYKGLDIGSAKVKKEQMQDVKHYMIDILNPNEDYDVYTFQKSARSYIDKILSKNQNVILAGGTGFYIQAIIRDVVFCDNAYDSEYRNKLYEIAKNENAVEILYEMLSKNDIKTAMTIDKYNIKRVIRALEFYHSTKKSMAIHNEEERKKSDYYKYKMFILTDDREKMYERINKRVDKMIDEGLENEIKNLIDKGYGNSKILNNAIGYREIIKYLNGDYDLQEAIRLIKQNTRHFAKRQLTWFKRQPDVDFINIKDFDYNLDRITDEILENI